MKSSKKTWSTRGGNGKPLQYSCSKYPMLSMKSPKDLTSEDEPPPTHQVRGVQYATGEEQRAITSNFRKNEVAGSKQK